MDEPRWSDGEKACIRALAEIFESGTNWVDKPRTILASKGFEADDSVYVATLMTMEEAGAVVDVGHTFEGQFWYFGISSRAVQLAREIKAKEEPGDIVSKVNENLRKSRWGAWLLIAFFVAVGLATFVSQTMNILEKLGFITK